jgi:3-deoxy-D-manno-octulosonic-acid transferase
MLSLAYRVATDLGAPLIGLYLMKRRAEGREDAARYRERLGHASMLRPAGKLIWCHAASVGEAASILALVERLREIYADTSILITTGTVASARMLEGRLPQGCFHQYVPVDRAPYVKQFLDHWRPDFVLLIESELWPNILHELRARAIPAALIQARMSDASFRRWYRIKSWTRELLGTFSLCLAQTEDDRSRFVALGARPVRCFGNLKYAAKPLPADEQELTRLRGEIGERPVWLFASSHRGEEEVVCNVQAKLLEKFPDLLTILVPRHAARGNEIAQMLDDRNIAYVRRSRREIIEADTKVYLADTMGELGLFYRLSQIVVIGGSFATVGGHNVIEPARLDCAIVFGPHMHNFSAIAQEFVRHNAAIQLRGANELSFIIDRLLNYPGERTKFTTAARALADEKRHVLEQTVDVLAPWLAGVTKKAA